jgi:hypothetical protein
MYVCFYIDTPKCLPGKKLFLKLQIYHITQVPQIIEFSFMCCGSYSSIIVDENPLQNYFQFMIFDVMIIAMFVYSPVTLASLSIDHIEGACAS